MERHQTLVAGQLQPSRVRASSTGAGISFATGCHAWRSVACLDGARVASLALNRHHSNGSVVYNEIDPSEVTCKSISVSRIEARNKVLIINLSDGTDQVLKVFQPNDAQYGGNELRNLETFQLIAADHRQNTARLMDNPDGSRLLKQAAAEDMVTLHDVMRRPHIARYRDLAAVGTIVGKFHRVSVAHVEHCEVRQVWIHDLLHVMKEWLSGASSGNIALVRILQSLTEAHPLMTTVQESCDANGFIHGDLRWANILVQVHDVETLGMIRIIDWEMAGLGDPCWDVGTVLSEFVAFWALSIPVVGGEPYEGLAKCPIEDMQPAMRAFWESYAEAMEFDRATARERLIKSVRFAGARLIQTAYERTQTMTHLTPHIYLLLQLSLNIMEGPEDAAEGLLGIPLPDGVGA